MLLTAHPNACIERVYSLVNKNKSGGSERNLLDIDGSLSSILAAKLDRPQNEYNDAHCSKNNNLFCKIEALMEI